MSSLFNILPPPSTIAEIQAKWRPCRECFFSSQFKKGPCLPNGSPTAKILVIGQWPGQEDMNNGIPFSGPQGRVCKDYLHVAGFLEIEMFYTNVLLCSCPMTPTRDILDNCKGQVDEVISVIKPDMIITLGGIAAKRLHIEPKDPRRVEYRGIRTIACIHPAAIARAKASQEKRALIDQIEAQLRHARRVYIKQEA